MAPEKVASSTIANSSSNIPEVWRSAADVTLLAFLYIGQIYGAFDGLSVKEVELWLWNQDVDELQSRILAIHCGLAPASDLVSPKALENAFKLAQSLTAMHPMSRATLFTIMQCCFGESNIDESTDALWQSPILVKEKLEALTQITYPLLYKV